MENIEPLIHPIESNQDICRIFLTDSIRLTIDLTLRQIKKYLLVSQANIFLYDSDGALRCYADAETYPEIIVKFAQYCASKKKSQRVTRAQIQESEITFPSNLSQNFIAFFVPIQIKNQTLGILYAGEPWQQNTLRLNHFRQLQLMALAFRKVFQGAILNSKEKVAYSLMPSALYFIQKDIYQGHFIRKIKERFTSLIEVSNLIHSYYDQNELIRVVIASAQSVLRSQSAALFMLDEKTNELYFDVISGDNSASLVGKRIPAGEGIVGLCVQNKEPIIVNDAINDSRVYQVTEDVKTKTRNLMAVPLLVENDCIGVLEVINTLDRPTYATEDLRLFESFAASVAIAIQNRC